MFRLAHLTDPHIGPLPPFRIAELMGKRLTGWLNWRRGRHLVHDASVLAKLVADLKSRSPNHIACTGDTSNLGLPGEWPVAKRFLEELGSPNEVSFVPGNHDAYVGSSLSGLLEMNKPYLLGDGARDIRFPYLRRRGNIALIGLSSAIPTPPFKAYGLLGPEQLQKLETMLEELGQDASCCRIVMIHHPPYVGGTTVNRELKDAAAFERVLAKAGAELVLFGHNHVASLVYRNGPRGRIPLVGAPSASSSRKDIPHRAAYHFFSIERSNESFTIEAERYGIRQNGETGLLERRTVLPETPDPQYFGTRER